MIDTTKYTQLLILKRHWALAVSVGVTVLAATIPLAAGLPDVYRSDAHLSIGQQVSAAGIDSTWASLDTRLQVIRADAQSRKNLIAMIERLNLYPSLREKASLDVVIDRVQRDIQFNSQTIGSPNGSTTTLGFMVGYIGDDPETVAEVANELANYWVEQNARIQDDKVQAIVRIYKGQLDDALKRLNVANDRKKDYAAVHADKLPDAVSVKQSELNKKNNQLNTAVGTQARLKERLRVQRTDLSDELQKVRDVGSTPDEAERATLLADIQKFSGIQGPGGPDVTRLQSRLKTVEGRIAASGRVAGGKSPKVQQLEGDIKDTQDELDAAVESVATLTSATEKLQGQIDAIPVLDPDYEIYKADAASARTSYEDVQKNLNAAIAAERAHGSSEGEFTLEDPARVPKGPYGPPRLNIIVGGVFLALVAGIAAAVLRSQLDTSFHTLEELREFTTVPVIGSVPRITTKAHRARQTALVLAGAAALAVVLAAVGVGSYHYAQTHAGITRIVSK